MTTAQILSLIMFSIIGLICISLAIHSLRSPEQKSRVGTALFWVIVGIAFIFGEWIPNVVIGGAVVVLAVLSFAKQVQIGKFKTTSDEFRAESAKKLRGLLFIPAIILALFAFAIAQWLPQLGAASAVGISAIIALIVVILITRTNPVNANAEGTRILSQFGPVAILPQILAALGTLFAAAGVGNAIASGVSAVVPAGNIWVGVIAYCIGMALFTMIMGNAFAAFAVMTAGIGIPFVFANGADPFIAGALAMTAGFCGTLMTPMAANFNIVPAALLEMKDKNGVIKAQAPVALIMLAIHIVLMRFLAF